MRTGSLIGLLGMFLAGPGCGQSPCGSGQLQLALHLSPTIAAGSSIQIDVYTDSGQQTQTVQHIPGDLTPKMSVPVSGTPGTGYALSVAVLDGDTPLWTIDHSDIVSAGCNQVALDSVVQSVPVRVSQSRPNKIDMLFVIDDSPGMLAKQKDFAASLPALLRQIGAQAVTVPAHYHFGMVTSDLGAGPSAVGNCKPGGKGGRLQAIGAGAAPGAMPPLGGVSYVDYNQLGGGGSNLPSGEDLLTALQNMVTAGEGGCTYPHSLEAAYRAIHDAPSLTQNVGFFRTDAILVVVFVTDDDDCSADPNSPLFSAPDNSAQDGRQNEYRCTRFGVMYGNPPMLMPEGDSGGSVADPRPADAATGLQLFPVDRYIDFFTKSGGAKLDPSFVMLAGVTGPSTPVSSVLAIAGSDPLQPCAAASPTCVPTLQHACVNPNTATLYGDPAVRLNAVIQTARLRRESSICEDDYRVGLADIGSTLSGALLGGCVSAPLADVDQPDCLVIDITADASGGTTNTVLPSCIGSTGPCWLVVPEALCPAVCTAGSSAQQLAVEIHRPGGAPPPNSRVLASCVVSSAPSSCAP